MKESQKRGGSSGRSSGQREEVQGSAASVFRRPQLRQRAKATGSRLPYLLRGKLPLNAIGLRTAKDFEAGDWLLAAFDIVKFGSRAVQVQNYLRQTMYKIIEQACADSEIPWPSKQWREDRGDGLLLVLPNTLAQRLIEDFIPYLYAGLRRHNELAAEAAKIEFRMGIHSGYVTRDDHALTGEHIVYITRLLDAPAFKASVARYQATLGVIASQRVYDDIIRPGRGLIDPYQYARLHIENKETITDAWVHLLYRCNDNLLELAPTG